MAVAIDVGPDFDTLPDNTLHGEAAAVDQRIDVFDMESAARSALDSLSCFVHGDAIDMEKTSRFVCGKRDAQTYIPNRSSGIGSPGTAATPES
jgi:hypothetical protein